MNKHTITEIAENSFLPKEKEELTVRSIVVGVVRLLFVMCAKDPANVSLSSREPSKKDR